MLRSAVDDHALEASRRLLALGLHLLAIARNDAPALLTEMIEAEGLLAVERRRKSLLLRCRDLHARHSLLERDADAFDTGAAPTLLSKLDLWHSRSLAT